MLSLTPSEVYARGLYGLTATTGCLGDLVPLVFSRGAGDLPDRVLGAIVACSVGSALSKARQRMAGVNPKVVVVVR